jgi:hypothetical protein
MHFTKKIFIGIGNTISAISPDGNPVPIYLVTGLLAIVFGCGAVIADSVLRWIGLPGLW